MYDPVANPRYIGPDVFDEQDAVFDDFDVDDAEDALRTIEQVLAVFSKRGWKHIEAYLTHERQVALDTVTRGGVTQRDEDKARGRIQTLDALLAYRERALYEKERLSEALENHGPS